MEQLQTFRRQRTPPGPPLTHPSRPGPPRRPAGGRAVAGPGARPRPAAAGNLRAKPVPRAPAPQPSGARDGPARGPRGLRPAPEVAGGRAGRGDMQGHSERGPLAQALRKLTSPPGHTGRRGQARSARGFRLPPGLLNFSGRKSRPLSGVTRQRAAPGGGSGISGVGLPVGVVLPGPGWGTGGLGASLRTPLLLLLLRAGRGRQPLCPSFVRWPLRGCPAPCWARGHREGVSPARAQEALLVPGSASPTGSGPGCNASRRTLHQ